MRSRIVALAVVTVLVLQPARSAAGGLQLPETVPQDALSGSQTTSQVSQVRTNQALAALARLHAFGYTINTVERAERAVRHWQRANGLTVDGVIGPEVLQSLQLTDSAAATAPAVRDNLPPGPTPDLSVEQIIRSVWPDDLEDRALAIAWRESRLVPTVRNACCWGLFQLNWSAHRSWLAALGISSASQLLDPATNASAAYALYLRDGWNPWRL